jgi:hypothetical protein
MPRSLMENVLTDMGPMLTRLAASPAPLPLPAMLAGTRCLRAGQGATGAVPLARNRAAGP